MQVGQDEEKLTAGELARSEQGSAAALVGGSSGTGVLPARSPQMGEGHVATVSWRGPRHLITGCSTIGQTEILSDSGIGAD